MSDKITLQEKFEKIVEDIGNNDKKNIGESFLLMTKEFSKRSPNKERVSGETVVDFMKKMLLSKKIMDSDSDFLEQYLMKDYLSKKESLEKFRILEKEKRLNDVTTKSYKELLNVLENPATTEKNIMNAEEYYLSNVFNPSIIDAVVKLNPLSAMPFIDKVEKDITHQILKNVESNVKVPFVKNNKNIIKMAIIESFHKSFNSKLSKTLSTTKIILNPVGFATGIVVKSAISLFMKTKAGENLSNQASLKWNKIFNAGKKSNLKKAAIVALAAFSVVGMTYAGLESYIPDNMTDAVHLMSDAASTELIEPVKNIFEVIPLGGNLESLSKSLLPDGATYDTIKGLTVKIASENGFYDASKIPENFSIKIPSNLDISNVSMPIVEIKNIDDIINLDIPYGAELKSSKLIEMIKDTLKDSNEFSNSNLLKIVKEMKIEINRVSVGGFIDTMKEPDFKSIIDTFNNSDIKQTMKTTLFRRP